MDERPAEEQLLEGGLDRVVDVAKYLKISTAQVYVLLATRQLPCVRIGRCRRCRTGPSSPLPPGTW
jgi:hypothetical protein